MADAVAASGEQAAHAQVPLPKPEPAPATTPDSGVAAAGAPATDGTVPPPPAAMPAPPARPVGSAPAGLGATKPALLPGAQGSDRNGEGSLFTGLDFLAALSSQEEAARKKAAEVAKVAKPAAPVSGYARASVLGRSLEQRERREDRPPPGPSAAAKDAQDGEDKGAESGPMADLDALLGFRLPGKKVTLKNAFELPDAGERKVPQATTTGTPKEAVACSSKLYIGHVPRGTPESAIRMECAKHGAVSSMFYCEDTGDSAKGGWACVTFATPEMADIAVRRMRQQVTLFGSLEPLEIRFASNADEAMPTSILRREEPRAVAPAAAEDAGSDDALDRDRRRKRRSSRSRRRRSRSRARRRRGDDRDSGHEGHALSSPGVIPNVVSKRRGLGGFDSATTGGPKPSAASGDAVEERPRQVAARGSWAQFVTPTGSSYYHNITTGETTWEKPADFDTPPSRRVGDGGPGTETSLFIFHLPPSWDEEMIMQHFRPFGSALRATVQRGSNGLSRGFGFVTFAKQEDAVVAVEGMNGFQADGKRLKVSLKNIPGLQSGHGKQVAVADMPT
uniref:Uncharacterized protein n=1 Tax=Alexandrium monilatum TaxID=311494 RepID=A0A7S4SN77_9DINO